MKRNHKVFGPLIFLSFLVLSSCNPVTSHGQNSLSENVTSNSNISLLDKYTITWKDYDGTVLAVDSEVSMGSMPTFLGPTPIRPASEFATYTFDKWKPIIHSVYQNQVYTASYTEELVKFTITIVLDGLRTDYKLKYSANLSFLNDISATQASTKFLLTKWYTSSTYASETEWSSTYLAHYFVNHDLTLYGQSTYDPYQIIAKDKSSIEWNRSYVYDPLSYTVTRAISHYNVPVKFIMPAPIGSDVIVATWSKEAWKAQYVEFVLSNFNGTEERPFTVTYDVHGFQVIRYRVQDGEEYLHVYSQSEMLEYDEYIFNITAEYIV
ncbi:MAG: hypothetical protein LKF69_03455 [Bacilli bacterium]|jgi:hypothetical protein|nr:hypothetical protein [Bacilli bacterium]MCH4235837.1 hypothetical protein [Bacilli bacterium]